MEPGRLGGNRPTLRIIWPCGAAARLQTWAERSASQRNAYMDDLEYEERSAH